MKPRSHLKTTAARADRGKALAALADAGELAATARDLSLADTAGTLPELLRGRQIALLCDGGDEAACECFVRGAGGLGALVSRLSLFGIGPVEGENLDKTALMLGRLYDAVACIGVPAERVAWLEHRAGIPVCGDLDPSGLSAAGLARDDAARGYLLQAMLVHRLR